MVTGNRETQSDATNGNDSTASGGEASSSTRRSILKWVGTGAVALAGLGGGPSPVAAQDGGPPNPDDWSMEFEDQFEGDSLGDAWEIGWGFGNTTTTSRTRIIPENTTVADGTLQLTGTHDNNNVLSGGVNTRNNVTFGPGSYFEARLQFASREGFHPAFWAKPDSGAWPPEIDAVEYIQDGSGRDDTYKSRHFLHYTASTEPGDKSTNKRLQKFYEPGDDLSENFHVYGVEWQSDGITVYVDGNEVVRWTDPTMLESMRKGAPFYINLAQNINVDSDLNEYLGTADLSEPWGETTYADWVRVWKQ